MTKLHGSNLMRMEMHINAEKLQSLRQRYRTGRPMRYVIRPLLMAILVTALLVGMLAVAVELTGDNRWFALTILLFVIALEAIYTTNWVNHPRQLPLNRVIYRVAELFLIMVIVRIASWIIFGEGIPDSAELIQYLQMPHTLFFNTPFLVTLLLVVIIWRLAVLLSHIFSQLEVSDYELHFHSLPPAQRKARADDQPIQAGRKGLVDAFARFWLMGGVLLAVSVGISTLEQQSAEALMAPLAAGRTNLEPRLLGALLLYFIIGLWLLSQARLMQTHARWLVNNVDADTDARQKWQLTSLLILILVAVVAAFFPIGSTSALSQIVAVILYWLLFLANVIIFLLVLPFALILALLSNQGLEESVPIQPMEPPAIPPQLESGTSQLAETVAMVLSSGFWTIFIAAIVLALLFFLRERKQEGSALTGGRRLLDQILAWLREQWLKLRGQARSLQESLLLLRETEAEPDQSTSRRSRWRFLHISSLSPREQIRYFYLSTLRRAGDRGVKRPPADTPSEYVQDLKQNWPEAEEALENLTEAFLKARYSDKSIAEEDIDPVKSTWKKARRELRQNPEQMSGDDGSEGD